MIGEKIRQTRTSKQMTLAELAERTQTTAGYLSQLERNMIDPSLSTLRKIAAALDTPLFAFIDEREQDSVLVPGNKRQRISYRDSNLVAEVLTPPASALNPDMLVLSYQIEPGSWSNDERISHNADECIYVQKGKIEVIVGDKTYALNAGDSIYIKENTPHNVFNPGRIKAICITAMTPASFISSVRP